MTDLKSVGFYIPAERDEDEVRHAFAELGTTIGKVLEETGMDEEGLARLLDRRQSIIE